MKFQPLSDRVLIKRTDAQEMTASGLYVPASTTEKPSEGTVVALGEGRMLEDGTVRKPKIKLGDRVLFTKYGGSEIKIDDEDYVIMREDDVLGVMLK